MDGLNSSSNLRKGKVDNGEKLRPLRRRKLLRETSRPDYMLLWRKAQRLVRTAPPTPDKHIDTWVAAHGNVVDALLHLFRFATDTKTEQRLVAGAVEEAHDFLKLYQEVINQPPPDDLELIEQVLRHRRESLQQLPPRQSPQP
jgi:hypothetical protein